MASEFYGLVNERMNERMLRFERQYRLQLAQQCHVYSKAELAKFAAERGVKVSANPITTMTIRSRHSGDIYNRANSIPLHKAGPKSVLKGEVIDDALDAA